ncbi:MAG: DUF4340 domain-containing protein [Ignavibacteriales bacterium]|nr:DUF4340 domain-containing protein [Ignavibacteriales bacterium]
MKKSNLLLIVAFVILFAITLLYLMPSGEREATYSLENVNIKFDSAAITKIEIKHSEENKSVTLENVDGKWKITSPVNYPADAPSAQRIVDGAAKFKISSLISSNVEKQSQFQVDSSGTQLTITEKNGKATTFIIGKSGPTYSEVYVRIPNKDDVYLAEGFDSYSLNKSVKDWRDRTIYKAERDSIKEISISSMVKDEKKKTSSPEEFMLIKDSSQWMVNGDSADNNKVNSLLGSLSNFRCDEFIDSNVTFSEMLGSVKVKSNSTAGMEETALMFYPVESDSMKYYVRTSTSSQVFQVSKWMMQNVLKQKSELLAIKKDEEKK